MSRIKHLSYYETLGIVIDSTPGIYQFVNKHNGKTYIGQSLNLRKRLTTSIHQLKQGVYHNKLLQQAWLKYKGYEGFDLKIIAKCSSIELDDIEKYYIAKFNSKSTKNGYNIESGGSDIVNRSKREFRQKQLSLNKGVAVYSLEGHLIESYKTLTECAKKLHHPASAIYGVCMGERLQSDGYIFKYVYDNYVQSHVAPVPIDSQQHPILLYKAATGFFVREVKNANILRKELGCTSTAISHCLNGINPTLQGFLLKKKWQENFPKNITPFVRTFNLEARVSKGSVIATSLDSSKRLVFTSAFEASKVLQQLDDFTSKGAYVVITRALNGQSKSAYGYKWEYEVLQESGKFQSTKTFDGFSACFRQYAATHSHCQLLHSYPLQFKVTFEGTLDHRNWIADFGSFKHNGVKNLLNYWFDHTTLCAEDDPELSYLIEGHVKKILDLRILPAGGCERYAEFVYHIINNIIQRDTEGRVKVVSVECFEHPKNSAIFKGL